MLIKVLKNIDNLPNTPYKDLKVGNEKELDILLFKNEKKENYPPVYLFIDGFLKFLSISEKDEIIKNWIILEVYLKKCISMIIYNEIKENISQKQDISIKEILKKTETKIKNIYDANLEDILGKEVNNFLSFSKNTAFLAETFTEEINEINKLKQENKELKQELKTKEKQENIEIAKNPKEFADQVQGLFTNTGFKTSDYKGYTDYEGNKKAKWQKDSLTALVGVSDLPLLDLTKKKKSGQGYLIPPTPKITVSQAKNLDTLIVLLEKQNRKKSKTGDEPTADIDFYFKDYAKIRGYTDDEIAKGGNFNNELKRDLISGGITSYMLEKEKSYLIGSFYTIEVPKVKSKEKWKVYFNEPYKSYILNVKQYYPILLQAIADKGTDQKKGYLYFFLKLVFSLGNNPKRGFKTQTKVSTILDRIKVSDFTKSRPQEAYKVLAECISYIADAYGAILTEIRLLNGKGGVKVIKDLTIFKTADYERFKADYLEDLELTDIRDALISFNTIAVKDESDDEPTDYQEGGFIEG